MYSKVSDSKSVLFSWHQVIIWWDMSGSVRGWLTICVGQMYALKVLKSWAEKSYDDNIMEQNVMWLCSRDFKSVIFKLILQNDMFNIHSLWNCSQKNATKAHWWKVNTSWCNHWRLAITNSCNYQQPTCWMPISVRNDIRCSFQGLGFVYNRIAYLHLLNTTIWFTCRDFRS